MYRFTDWQRHWTNLDLPWTGEHANDAFFQMFARAQEATKELKQSAFVPLSGDSPVVRWLYEEDFSVTAVEYVPEAVAQLMQKSFPELKFKEENLREGKKYTAPRLNLFVQDIFQFIPSEKFSMIYDRGAYVALGPETRKPYAGILRQNLAPGGCLLLRTAEIIGGEWKGPPYSITLAEIEERFSGLTVIESNFETIAATQERYLEAGVSEFRYASFLFQKPRAA